LAAQGARRLEPDSVAARQGFGQSRPRYFTRTIGDRAPEAVTMSHSFAHSGWAWDVPPRIEPPATLARRSAAINVRLAAENVHSIVILPGMVWLSPWQTQTTASCPAAAVVVRSESGDRTSPASRH